MGGHGHDDHHAHGNEHNIQETNAEMPYRIRDIETIKHYPNLFHLWIWNPNTVFEILGGAKFAVTAAAGGVFGYWYYS